MFLLNSDFKCFVHQRNMKVMLPFRRCCLLPTINRNVYPHSQCLRPITSIYRTFASGINERRTLDLTFLDDIFCSESTRPIKESYDVILLNAPHNGLIPKLCRGSNTVICADGGANALYKSMDNKSAFVPNAIVGDLDSIEPQVLDYFVERGTHKICVEDQNQNDFQKSLLYLLDYLLDQQTESKHIICWGAFGDRFDHQMQSFNVIYKYYRKLKESDSVKNIVLLTDRNFAILLTPGKHHIKCAKLQGPFCGVIPLYSAATVTTNGLKYDMNGTVLEFGGLVSSSNGFTHASDGIDIETDEIIVLHTTCSILQDS